MDSKRHETPFLSAPSKLAPKHEGNLASHSVRAGRGISLWEFPTRGEIPRPSRLLKVTSFPRKRESIGVTVGPRLRWGDESDFHHLGWATGPWKLLGMTSLTGFSAP